MQPAPPDLEGLPEPHELHARYSTRYPLDWGESLPTAAQIAKEFGVVATRAALKQLGELGRSVDLATGDLVAAVPPGGAMYQLEHRLKSPQSLARRLAGRVDKDRQTAEVEDIQRYTYLTDDPRFVDLAKSVTQELQAKGWQLTRARNSYVDRSRYKGLHLDWRTPGGQRVEVQVHTPRSVAVKESTTRLYETERDRRRPPQERDTARAECVRLSASLAPPQGLDELDMLAGCKVEVRGYGLEGGAAPVADVGPQDGRVARPERQQNLRKDRMER
jgi:predicted RNA binding protein YcfA (HicA-like mRNA interferase family)